MRFGGRALAALLILPLLAAAAWIMHRSRMLRDDPAAVLVALRAAHGPSLPDASAVGARSRSEPESFDRETLYQYIDGAAEAYLAQGFQRCLAADYVFDADAKAPVEVTAEVYRFAEPAGAAARFAAETPRGAGPVAGQARTVSDGDVLLGLRERDLLKVTVLTPGPGAAAALERTAAAWRKGS